MTPLACIHGQVIRFFRRNRLLRIWAFKNPLFQTGTLPSFVPPQKCLILSGDSLAGRSRAIVFAGGNTMKLFGTREIDNRDTEQVYDYMEARIEALKQRIHELEAEKESLQANHWHTQVA
jgi:hypothetical protein